MLQNTLLEEDAWKMVTLNPAKLLHLDGRMGSLKIGKDADIVIWDGNPLSVYTTVEQTYVDGRLLYDKIKNKELMNRDLNEKMRIINKMINGSSLDEKSQKIGSLFLVFFKHGYNVQVVTPIQRVFNGSNL